MAQPSTQPPSQRSNTETFTQDSYNHGGLITFIVAMATSVIFFIALLVLHPGVDLKETAPETPANAEAGAAPAADADGQTRPEAGPPSPTTDNKDQ